MTLIISAVARPGLAAVSPGGGGAEPLPQSIFATVSPEPVPVHRALDLTGTTALPLPVEVPRRGLNENPGPGAVPTLNLEQYWARTRPQGSDTLYVVNFWATWCIPCVKELPYFEKAGVEFASQPVQILLVSLDFKSEKEKLANFIRQRNLRNPVYLLDAGSPDVWINAIDSSWTGSIPATVFYRNGEKLRFIEDELSQEELTGWIRKWLGQRDDQKRH